MKTILDVDELVFGPPELGCVLYIPGLPGGGSKIYDRSPYVNIGTITGATWVRIPSGLWCLYFDGSDDEIDCGNDSSLNLTTTFSLCFWMIADVLTSPSRRIISKMELAGNWQYDIQPAYFIVTPNGSTLVRRTCAVETRSTTWKHIVGVFDGPNARLDYFVNGVLQNGELFGTIPAATQSTNVKVYIGRRPGGDFFKGSIALPRVLSNALSAGEVYAQFNREKHLFGVW